MYFESYAQRPTEVSNGFGRLGTFTIDGALTLATCYRSGGKLDRFGRTMVASAGSLNVPDESEKTGSGRMTDDDCSNEM